MAGSYNHVVTKKTGKLRKPADVCGMLEARGNGDVYEAVEEMYGMIWLLAERLETLVGGSREQYVKMAQENYVRGLKHSPGQK